MNRGALVIMYAGQEPSNYIKEKLSQLLITTQTSDGTSDIDIYYFNDREVANGVLKNIGDDVVSEHFRKSEHTPQEAAVIYIGTLCSKSISYGNFSFDLLQKCLDVFKNRNSDDRLINAIRLIAQDYSLSRVSDDIQTKYHFGTEEYKIVCRIYEVCQKLQGE